MDSLFFHPKLVHIPMALAVLMPLVASGLLLAWWRGWLPRQGWLVAVALQAVLVVSGFAALRSGEAEEEQVERVVAEQYIEAHEEAAEGFVLAGGLVLAVMLVGGALGGRRWALPVAAAATLGTLVVFAQGYRTGQAGGRLVYEQGAAQVYVAAATGTAAKLPADAKGAQEEEDDDD